MSILKDVLVVDFSQGYSGDFCTMQLADFGARESSKLKEKVQAIWQELGNLCKMDKVAILR